MQPQRIDFNVRDHGSVVSFDPKTDGARDWLRDNIAAQPWQWVGQSVVMDRRHASDVLAGVQSDGLEVVFS